MAIEALTGSYRQDNGAYSQKPYIRLNLQFDNATMSGIAGLIVYHSEQAFFEGRPPIKLQGMPDAVPVGCNGQPIAARTSNIADRLLRIITEGVIQALENPESPFYYEPLAGRMTITSLTDEELP